jgi:hypothetical protein
VTGLGLVVVCATRSNATASEGGNRLPRFSARRRIPAQALWLKEYLSRCSPVSKMSDNDDATAPLGNSEPLSVQHSVGEPIPQVPQRPEDGTQVPSSS